jgi:hypothetical protein
MRTTHNERIGTSAPSATLNTQATPHTSNRSAPKKLVSILLTKCLLIELYLSGILNKQAATKRLRRSEPSPGTSCRAPTDGATAALGLILLCDILLFKCAAYCVD